MNGEQVAALANHILDRRYQLLSLWQEIADNFYPERADFTLERSLGTEFADHLMSSYPLLVRRELGNAFTSMLRPKQKQWFHITTSDEDRAENIDAKRWLEYAEKVQRRAMYDPAAQFVRTTREGDHDFTVFGQCAMTVNLNRNRDALLYRSYHLKDVGWLENAEGEITTVARRWNPTAKDLKDMFGEDALSAKTQELLKGEASKQYTRVQCRHVLMPSEDFGDKWPKYPYVSVHVEVEGDTPKILEDVGLRHFEYVIPRWQVGWGSQYAFSPATVCALPDARLLQAMMLVLLESGEKATNPPMVAVDEAVRSDISIYAGGVTWVDAEYDERMGEVLRPISQDYSGVPTGLELHDRIASQLSEAFYLNKLSLPPAQVKEMTAYEVSQRVEEYVRSALPLFEPMEQNYNGQLCEKTFEVLFQNGAFGAPTNIPSSLMGADVEFKFESPLHENIERIKGQKFLEAREYLMAAAEIDTKMIAHVNIKQAFRDALQGIGVPAEWIRSEREALQVTNAMAEQEQAAEEIAAAQAGAEAAKTAGQAEQEINNAQRSRTATTAT